MDDDDEHVVWFDANNLPPGRINRPRIGGRNPNLNDTEPYPVITAEDREATRRLGELEGWLRPRAKV